HEETKGESSPSPRQRRPKRQPTAGGRPGPETRTRRQKIGRPQHPVHLIGNDKKEADVFHPPRTAYWEVIATIFSSPCRASDFFSSTLCPSCKLVNRTGVMGEGALSRITSRSTSINF